MTDAELLSFGPSTALPANTVVRITFQRRFIALLSDFAAMMALVHQKMPAYRVIPITYLNVPPGATATVVDATVKDAMTGAQLLAHLADAVGAGGMVSGVEVARVERLTGAQVAQSGTSSGADERDKQAAGASVPGAAGILGNVFGGIADTAKWAALAFIAYLVWEARERSR